MVLNINYCLGFKCEACHVTKMELESPDCRHPQGYKK